jgi:predicted O-methyltransferase YrrM
MDFLDPALENYVANHTQQEPQLLAQLDRETHLKVMNPRMLAGHVQGRFLSMLSFMIKPQRILEIGTYTGYSALCWAEGLAENGHIHTIDRNEELAFMTKKYFKEAGIEDRVTWHVGQALDIIPTIDERWDVVFIDADKSNYGHYYDLVFDSVKPGGYIIADNVLWSGKVIQQLEKNDRDTAALLAFNEKVTNDNRVENVLVAIRDGLMVARKL